MSGIHSVTVLTALLLAVPLWVFSVPLLILMSVCIMFRHRAKVRIVCVAVALVISLLAIPFLAVQGYFRLEADERLQAGFDVRISPSVVATYRFKPGLLHSVEYWRLRNLDPNTCGQIVSRNNLARIEPGGQRSPGGFAGSPSWWPKSTSGFSVFQGEDRDGGTKEIWISTEGSVAYLFCSLE